MPSAAAPDARHLFLLRVLYFLGGLSGATWGRFSTVFFNGTLHLSPSQIGLLEAVMPGVRFFFQPLWGVVADRCPRVGKKGVLRTWQLAFEKRMKLFGKAARRLELKLQMGDERVVAHMD